MRCIQETCDTPSDDSRHSAACPLPRRAASALYPTSPCYVANSSQYLPLRDIDTVTNALNFSTPDCHVIGGCDIYTTKAAGGDKKLYKNIENGLESQYESLVRLSASLSPPYQTASDDGRGNDRYSRQRGSTVEIPEIDLSRASPFGPLSQITARRTFAYLIATLNASHPDYDFSHLLRPSDFRKERSLRSMMNNMDSMLQNLRPRQTAAMNYLSPPSLSSSAPAGSGSAGGEVWNQNMWRLIDKEMSLRHCERFSYAPDDDPFDGDEGAIWSTHYFFFNKEKKRVCYVYLRGFSVISHSPVHEPSHMRKPAGERKISYSLGDEGASKRASYWLSNDLLQREIETFDCDDEDDEIDQGDDEVEVPFMDLDDLRSHLVDGRGYSSAIEEDDEDAEDFTFSSPSSWKDTATTSRHVRGLSEEIGESMDLDL